MGLGLVLLAVFLIAVAALARIVIIHRGRLRLWSGLDGEAVRGGLGLLLKRGYDGAVAQLTDERSGHFVQFRKYIASPGEIGLEMHFPRSAWSEPYYSGVQDILRDHGVDFARIGLPSDPTPEVVHADFGRDIASAAKVLSDIVLRVFGSPLVSVTMRFDDICPVDEMVDAVDHPRPVELLVGRGRNRPRS